MQRLPPLTRGDVVLIIALLMVGGAWFAIDTWRAPPGCEVEIRSQEGLVAVLPLDRDVTVRLEGPLGESVVVIEGGEVSMLSSPCPHQLCLRRGRIHKAGSSIVCIPNRVYVLIRGETASVDGVSY